MIQSHKPELLGSTGAWFLHMVKESKETDNKSSVDSTFLISEEKWMPRYLLLLPKTSKNMIWQFISRNHETGNNIDNR